MSKQQRSLGTLASMTSSDERPLNPEPDNIYDRVDKLERRVATLEGLLNDMMHQMDKPVRDQNLRKTNGSHPKSKKSSGKEKTKKAVKSAPKPNPDQDDPKLNPNEAPCRDLIRALLSDDKKVPYREFFDHLPENHGFSKKAVKRVQQYMYNTGEIVVSVENIDGKKVSFGKLSNT